MKDHPGGSRRRISRMTAIGLALVALSLFGCDGDLPTVPDRAELDGIELTGGVNVAESFPVQLGFFLDATNTTDEDRHVVTDGCGVLPRAYRNAARTGRPAWDGRPGAPCRASVAPVTVPAGATRRFERSYSAREVLGDSLPDGRYYFTVTYRAGLAGAEDEVRLIEIAAGEADLALPPDEE